MEYNEDVDKINEGLSNSVSSILHNKEDHQAVSIEPESMTIDEEIDPESLTIDGEVNDNEKGIVNNAKDNQHVENNNNKQSNDNDINNNQIEKQFRKSSYVSAE